MKYFFKGTGAAIGSTVGKVKIFNNISNINSLDLLDKEVVMVLPFTTPKIIPFLPKIKAIITEKGGITSHAAIIGREFGIPTVVGLKNITKLLRNNQWVLVNGRNGTVEIFPKTSIQFVQWDITNICNLRCKHCRAWKLPERGKLTTREGLNLLDQLYDLKVQILNFSGGEPFLRRDIFTLLEQANNFPSVTITTNGTLLNKGGVVKKLKKFRNLRISLSLDGIEKFHDNFRQVPGTFKRAVTAIKTLTRTKIPTSVRFTLTKHNENEALKVFNFVSRFGIESFNIRTVLPFGKADGSLIPSPEQYKMVVEKLLIASKHKKIPIISGDPILLPLFPELLGKTWKKLRKKVYSEIYAGCLAGDEVLYIKPNGDVGVCAYIPKVVGNIRKNSLIELINKAPLFQQLTNCRDRLKGKCGKCKFKYLCGGCRAAALAINKNLFAEDPRCLVLPIK